MGGVSWGAPVGGAESLAAGDHVRDEGGAVLLHHGDLTFERGNGGEERVKACFELSHDLALFFDRALQHRKVIDLSQLEMLPTVLPKQ
ncbi:MAG: hypothetical protein IPF99_29210 [Deltaproteobacteria bacterium]|nr:hypothetical protein [Deltaproteobacteria bacterium]